jgi:hypothetical protein
MPAEEWSEPIEWLYGARHCEHAGYGMLKFDTGFTIIVYGLTRELFEDVPMRPLIIDLVDTHVQEWIDKHGDEARPCTCTLACIPQSLTDSQHCRLRE